MYSVKNQIQMNSLQDAYVSNKYWANHSWIQSKTDDWLNVKEAWITEEDDDDALSIPFECSLPQMRLQDFLGDTWWGSDTFQT